MKNNEIDRLFRQKLKNLQPEPSPHAWQQLEEKLQQKKGLRGWYYFPGIAASLLLLFGIWAAIELTSHTFPDKPVARKQELNKEKAAQRIVQKEPEPALKEAPVTNTQAGKSGIAVKEDSGKNSRNGFVKPLPASGTKQRKETTGATLEIKPERVTEKQISALVAAEAKSLHGTLSATTKSIAPLQIQATPAEAVIIRYSTDFAENALGEKEESKIAANGSQEEKELSARKVIGFLKKVKSSTGNIAELREAKDELLSFRLGKAN